MNKSISVLILLFFFHQSSAQYTYKVAYITAYYTYTPIDSIHTDTIGINYWNTDSAHVNTFLAKYSSTLNTLIIENANNILWEIDLNSIPNLETLMMYGNDFCTDRLPFMRDDILQLPKLKKVIFDGEGLPPTEFMRIKRTYPSINFSGDICELK